MDSFELNKILGATLFSVLCLLVLGIVAEVVYSPATPAKPGYEIAVAEPTAPAGGAGAAPAEAKPIGPMLASADPKAGADAAKKCVACHSLGKGEAAKVGPNLYGIVANHLAHMDGFSYSDGMKQKAAAGDTWTYDNLNHFLTSPKAFVPGTKMSFAGIKSDAERANVIAYLRTLADSPQPLP